MYFPPQENRVSLRLKNVVCGVVVPEALTVFRCNGDAPLLEYVHTLEAGKRPGSWK